MRIRYISVEGIPYSLSKRGLVIVLWQHELLHQSYKCQHARNLQESNDSFFQINAHGLQIPSEESWCCSSTASIFSIACRTNISFGSVA